MLNQILLTFNIFIIICKFFRQIMRSVCFFDINKYKKRSADISTLLFSYVILTMPATGIEPVRILLRRILSPVRLPVPPRRHNGQWWIRTTEASCSRFTVCPLWPLGKLPIIDMKAIRCGYNRFFELAR